MKFTLGSKILVALLVLTIVPLVVLGMIAASQVRMFGEETIGETSRIGDQAIGAATTVGELAVKDSENALVTLAKGAIETRTQDAARTLAGFLHERDADILLVRTLHPDDIDAFLSQKTRAVNIGGKTGERPLYIEYALLDLSGKPTTIVKTPGTPTLDFSAEGYAQYLDDLGDGDIYVSTLWGRALLISTAYAGVEKPAGIPYEGYYRFITPRYEGGKKVGYVSLKLDARHVMEIVMHLSPTDKRYVDLPDAPSGNYAYFIGADGWVSAHPREYNIKGVLADGSLAPPLDNRPGAIPLAPDTKPLHFGHLSGFSKELDEIHTVHAMAGESGSQIYPWAGLTKWVAYAPVDYHTGPLYEGKMGFGWIGLGAEINKFKEPANATRTTISAITADERGKMELALRELDANVRGQTNQLISNTVAIVIVSLLLVILIGYFLAKSIARPVVQITEAARKLNEGDLDVKVPTLNTHDEVEDLAMSVEMLAAGLRAQRDANKAQETRAKKK
jgi:hypothetical protein